jgi:hypothetical protein
METQSEKKAEDHLSELNSLAKKFLPGTCWKSGDEYHQVESVCMDISTTHAKTKRITFDIISDVDYVCSADHGLFFYNDIASVVGVTRDEYYEALENTTNFLVNKQNLLLDRRCLLNPITEFSDLESIENFISSNTGLHHFAYQPTSDTFRIFAIDSAEYIGQDLEIQEQHFHLSANQAISRVRKIKFSHVGDRPVFYITQYQFNELLKIIKIDENL